jgi:predicted MPP superfamily phosphohydrolase
MHEPKSVSYYLGLMPMCGTERQREIVQAVIDAGGLHQKAADALGIAATNVSRTIRLISSSIKHEENIDTKSIEDRLKAAEAEVKSLKDQVPKARMIKDIIYGDQHRVKRAPVFGSSGSSGGHGVPVLFLSDIHYGETVYPSQIGGVNEYNEETANRRIRSTFETAANLTIEQFKDPDFDGIVVAMGGDMLSGTIHEELSESNWAPINVLIYKLQDQLIAGIELLRDHFDIVYIPCVVGNHGRHNKQYRAKNKPYDNFEYILYHNIAHHYRDDDDVVVHVADDTDITFSVYGTTFRMTHGDQFRGGNGISGITMPIFRGNHKKQANAQAVKQPYDVLMIGHFHQYMDVGSIVVNGSIKGYDEYAYQSNFSFEPPQQAMFFVNPKFGRTYRMPIFCEPKPNNEKKSKIERVL